MNAPPRSSRNNGLPVRRRSIRLLVERSDGWSGQFYELIDSPANRHRQEINLRRTVIGRTESVADLPFAELQEKCPHPFRLPDLDVVKQSSIPPAVAKSHAVALHFLYEPGLRVVLRVVAAAREATEEREMPGLAEGRAQVADGEQRFGDTLVALWGHVEDDVVGILEVPVVQERHHHNQPLQLRAADERIPLPPPLPCPLDRFRPRLEPDVSETVALTSVSLPPGPGRAVDVDARDEVIDFGLVADGPHQSYGCGLRLGLPPDLRHPLAPARVTHAILRRVAAFLGFDEGQAARIRPHLSAARPQQQVARLDVCRLSPQHGTAYRHGLLLLISLVLKRRRSHAKT